MSVAELGNIFDQLKQAPAPVFHMFKDEGKKGYYS